MVVILVNVILVIVLIMDVISRCSGYGYNSSQCNSSRCSNYGYNSSQCNLVIVLIMD